MLLLSSLALAHTADYDSALLDLQVDRLVLAERWNAGNSGVLDEARSRLEDVLVDEIFPAWFGTPWEFYGTTQTPGTGTIACGYFVSTTLEHAGFDVERAPLAQQPAQNIIRTFAPRSALSIHRDVPVSTVIADLHTEGDGIYLVGLDYHVGYLVRRDGQVDMCHSSYLGSAGVVCEDALTSPAMVSRYTVFAKLLDDAMVMGWLEGGDFPTFGR